MAMEMTKAFPVSRRTMLAGSVALLGACRDFKQDIHYIPTPRPVVEAMLQMAEIGPDDVLYDLGSGDGRIPITAALEYGIRAVGIEIDPSLIEEARDNAAKAGVAHLVSFREDDLFATDFSDATVIAIYLGDMLNLRLRPRLLELKPGTAVVSQSFNMGDWVPDEKRIVANRPVYRWTVPHTFIPGFPSP